MIDVSMDVSTCILFDVVCYSDCGEENSVVFSTMQTVVHDVSCSHSFAEIVSHRSYITKNGIQHLHAEANCFWESGPCTAI